MATPEKSLYIEIYRLKSENAKLRKACKEFVQWFDYVQAYQQENLGKGFEKACDNWNSIYTPDPSPSIDKMRQALKDSEQHEKGQSNDK